MSPFEQAKSNALKIIEDDYTELWFIVCEIRKELPDACRDQIREVTKRIVEELMAAHGVKVLDVETELPLPLDSQQVNQMIDEVFSKIKGLPTIGDGFWLGIPLPRSSGTAYR